MLKSPYLMLERLNDSRPVLCPTANWWEDGVTFNPAAIFIQTTPKTLPVIHEILGPNCANDTEIQDGVVAVHYRARPKQDRTDRVITPSYSGLAVFSPKMDLLCRHQDPIILPDDNKKHYDHLGVEDGRLHSFDGQYYYLYCGVCHWDNPEADWPVKAQLCLAKSSDLLTWEKLGPIQGTVNKPDKHNKDGVFFPDKIDGRYFMLHRPCYGPDYSTYAMALAVSSDLEGTWTDLGTIKTAPLDVTFAKHAWVGAGSVPIPVGNQRYLVIYHRGHFLHSGQRWYDLHAAIFNFNRFDPKYPSRLLEKRLERILVPETPYERNADSADGVANVVFTCGSYEYEGCIYILYGGADCVTLAARVEKQQLLDALENTDTIDI